MTNNTYYCNRCKCRHRSGSKIYKDHKSYANTGRPKRYQSNMSEINSIFPKEIRKTDKEILYEIIEVWLEHHKVGVDEWVKEKKPKKFIIIKEGNKGYNDIKKQYNIKEESYFDMIGAYSHIDENEFDITLYEDKNMLRIEIENLVKDEVKNIFIVKNKR